MGRASASDELLWEALRIAQAEAFVKQLPLRLEAPEMCIRDSCRAAGPNSSSLPSPPDRPLFD